MNAYGSFLPVVQETIRAYDSATKVESGSNVAVVGPLIGQLQAHERDIVVALTVYHAVATAPNSAPSTASVVGV